MKTTFLEKHCTEYNAKDKDFFLNLYAINITKEERKDLKNLRKDDSHIFITADKGVVPVLRDEGIYIEKCMPMQNGDKVCKESRGQSKQLLDLKKIQLETNSRNSTTNISLLVKTVLCKILWSFKDT